MLMAIQMGFGPGDFDVKTWRAVAAEFIATGLFVFLGTGTVVAIGGGGSPEGVIAIALAHGIAIAVLVAAIARISGGHINPAVTFAAAMTGKMKVSTGCLYVAAQLSAAVLGVLLLKGIVAGPVEGLLGAHGLNVYSSATGLGILDSSVGDGAGAGLLLEGVLTFALVFVIFAPAIDPKGLPDGHRADGDGRPLYRCADDGRVDEPCAFVRTGCRRQRLDRPLDLLVGAVDWSCISRAHL